MLSYDLKLSLQDLLSMFIVSYYKNNPSNFMNPSKSTPGMQMSPSAARSEDGTHSRKAGGSARQKRFPDVTKNCYMSVTKQSA